MTAKAIRDELVMIQDRLHFLKKALDQLRVHDPVDRPWQVRCSERINIGTDILRSAQIGIEVGFELPDEEIKDNG